MGGGEPGPSSPVPIFSTDRSQQSSQDALTRFSCVHAFLFDVPLFFFLALSGPNVCFSLFAKLPPLVGGVTNVVGGVTDPQP